jgi:hypothetical protein
MAVFYRMLLYGSFCCSSSCYAARIVFYLRRVAPGSPRGHAAAAALRADAPAILRPLRSRDDVTASAGWRPSRASASSWRAGRSSR